MKYIHFKTFENGEIETELLVEYVDGVIDPTSKEYNSMFSPGELPKFCCIIEGDSHTEIMKKYYLHNDWGEYTPIIGRDS